MADDVEKCHNEVVNTEEMGKKADNEPKSANSHDEDTESVEEQPLDIGEHYLVRRTDESWCKLTN